MYISIFLPYKFSFIEDTILLWEIMDFFFDVFFFFDIIITFFIPYFDKNKFVTSHAQIAKNYVLSFWFWIDVVSIVPLELFLKSDNDLSLLLKILKLPRFYKMVFYGCNFQAQNRASFQEP